MIGRTNSIGSKGLPTQDKTLTITQNGVYTILPDAGNVLSSATANVMVEEILNPEKKWLVRFFDYKGKVLRAERVNTGEDATAPEVFNTADLAFAGWNNTFTNIQADTDVGAIYTTITGETLLYITTTPVTGKNVPLNFYIRSVAPIGTVTINWGDGTSNDTRNTAGAHEVTHIYANHGSYVIRISCANGTYRLGGSTNNVGVFGSVTGTYQDILTKVHFGANVYAFFSQTFQNCRALRECVTATTEMANSDTAWGAILFRGCRSLLSFNIPTGTATTAIGSDMFRDCSSLKSVVMGNNVTSIGTNSFLGCASMEKLNVSRALQTIDMNGLNGCFGVNRYDFPSTLTTINTAGIINNYALCCLIFRSTTPPTMVAGALDGINRIAKIYVPDAQVATYKTATNWVAYADYIYPLSDIE